MTGSAEDLQIADCVRSAEGYRDNVIDIPELTGRNSDFARLALAFGFEEEIQSCFC